MIPPEQNTLVVSVIDPSGNPLAGATVTPIGLRSIEEPGTSYNWVPGKKVNACAGITDPSGKAEISFPSHPREDLTASAVIVLADHPSACLKHIEINVKTNPPISLAPGTLVEFTAIPVAEVAFASIYLTLTDRERQAHRAALEHDAEKLTVLARLPDGHYLARMVAVAPSGDAYFSDFQSFDLPGASVGKIQPFTMQKGIAFLGILDSSVPRPIKSGCVIIRVNHPAPSAGTCRTLSLDWAQWTSIEPDGTFHLDNMPSGPVELVAVCDGYHSRNGATLPKPGQLKSQLLDGNQDPVIPMEKTGNVRVLVRQPNNSPLLGATVYSCPNQSFAGGTGIVGSCFNTLDYLEAARTGAEVPSAMPPNPFQATTAADGIAILKNLPHGEQSLQVAAEGHEMPIEKSKSEPRRSKIVIVPEGGTVEITVKMDRANTSSLRDALQRWRR